MSPLKTEENYPLLLLFLDDSDKDREKRRRNVFFENKNRYNRITEGASNVLTQWPNHISTCWLYTFLFFILFLVVMSVVLIISAHPMPIQPRCLFYKLNDSNTKIFLVHHGAFTQDQLEAIETILKNYPNMTIDLIALKNRTMHSKHRHKRHYVDKWNKMDINVGNPNILRTMGNKSMRFRYVKRQREKTQHDAHTLQSLMSSNPLINLRNETMRNYFDFTPIHNTWMNLNLDLLEFAARAFMLWEFGGLSFKLPESNTHHTTSSEDEELRIETFMHSNITSFRDLPEGVVNIDDEGVHMETKTPCHAYFAEVLANLRHADANTTVESVVRQSLKTFCISGSVNDQYCLNFLQ